MTKIFLALSSLSLFAFAAGCAGHDEPEPESAQTEEQSAAAVGFQCKDVGGACSYAGQCCSANCSGGVCKAATTCRVNSAFCHFNSKMSI